MVDFRKWLPAFAGLALLTLGSQAHAQVQPFVCNASSAVPTLARGEGLTELTGDIVLNCNTTNGQPVSSTVVANIQIFLNTNVTSKAISASYGNTESLLLLNEPVVGNRRLATGVDAVSGQATPGTANVFRGTFTSTLPSSLTWLGVPVLPAGSNQTTIRITNVRADATTQLSANPLVPGQIIAYISISGSQAVTVNNPQQTVAFVQRGLTGTVTNAGAFQQCINLNFPTTAAATAPSLISFSENFATAFKERNLPSARRPNPEAGVTDQRLLGFPYNTESGLTDSSFLNDGTGQATTGTKLIAQFTNIPAGVGIYVTTTPVAITSSQVGTITTGLGNFAVLVSADANGVTAGSALSASGAVSGATSGSTSLFPGTTFTVGTATSLSGSFVQINSGNVATGSATWEIVGANPGAIETFYFGVIISYQSQTTAGLPPLTPATGATAPTITLNFAPLYPNANAPAANPASTVSSSLPVPRFQPNPTAGAFFSINTCATNLLFPFITTVTGFETGVAISNTSQDPFGTQTQQGACTLYLYANGADTTPAGTVPGPFTTPIIPPGTAYRFILSTGAGAPSGLTAPTGANVPATLAGVGPNFTGYLIARCAFQYAHGFAFISDPGSRNFAEGYLALIIPDRTRRPEPFSTGGAQTGETLGH